MQLGCFKQVTSLGYAKNNLLYDRFHFLLQNIFFRDIKAQNERLHLLQFVCALSLTDCNKKCQHIHTSSIFLKIINISCM